MKGFFRLTAGADIASTNSLDRARGFGIAALESETEGMGLRYQSHAPRDGSENDEAGLSSTMSDAPSPNKPHDGTRREDHDAPLTPWVAGNSRLLAKTRILELHEQAFHCPDAPERGGNFSVIRTSNWVNVVALTDPGDDEGPRLILVEQYRFGTAENTLEIVGGVIDEGEDPIGAGPRELLEETGYAGREPVRLGSVDANPAIMNNHATTLLIEGCRLVGEQSLDPNEHIAVRLVPIGEVPSMIADGRISNAIVVAALFHYFVNGPGSSGGG